MINGDNINFHLGILPGVNHNLMQPSFRYGPRRTPRRLWPIFLSVVVTLLAIAALITFSILS